MGQKPIIDRNELITALSIAVLAVVYLIAAVRLPIGTAANPGPGFIPIVVGLLLVICTGILLARSLSRKKWTAPEPAGTPEPTSNLRVFGIIFGTLAYPFALEWIGFLASTWAVTFFMLLLLKPKNWTSALVLAVFLSLSSFGVFSILLGVSFPFGFLDELIYRITTR
ncbi:MAG: tripartite tricarboxylate transporter TctB family protein [Desulfobacterales bacterium]|jgi:hypothetical protein|nr:tripartite tricarboxylate transporter TctB family protein [Desulfobacterales bacterium]